MSIRIFTTKMDAMKAITPEKHIWGYEKKGGTGAMSYIVGTHDRLIDMYARLGTQRYHHEILLDDNHPTKLFFDIDGPPSTDPAIIEQLHEYVVNLIGGCISPVVLDASGQEKYSKHVIYPMYFTNKSILREFVFEMRDSIPVDDPLYKLIDFGVYDTDHSLRILGSSKRNIGRPFTYEGREKVSRPILGRSLIRYVDESDKLIKTWGEQEEPRQGVKRKYMSSEEVVWEGWPDGKRESLSDKLVTHVRKKYKCKYINVKWLGNTLAVNIHPGVVCTNKQARHKKNSSSILFTIPKFYNEAMDIAVKVICMDMECQTDSKKHIIDIYNIPVRAK